MEGKNLPHGRFKTLAALLTERRDWRPATGTSSDEAVIHQPPPISMPLSSNGNGGGGGQHRQTGHQWADVIFTDITRCRQWSW